MCLHALTRKQTHAATEPLHPDMSRTIPTSRLHTTTMLAADPVNRTTVRGGDAAQSLNIELKMPAANRNTEEFVFQALSGMVSDWGV